MRGQTVARILLVITLIVTAHAIKPFSAKNIASHLLYSSRSLAFILPDSARSGFDHASQLALTLSDSLFSDEKPGFRRSNEISAGSDSIAINPELSPDISSYESGATTSGLSYRWHTRASTDITSYESGATIKKARVSMKRQYIAVNSIDSDLIELAGPETLSEPIPAGWRVPREFPAAMPVALPVLRLKMECALLKRIQPIRVDLFHLMPPKMRIIYEPKKAGCDKLNGKQTKLIAFLEKTEERLKSDWIRAERSVITMVECEETEEDYAAESQELPSSTQEFDGLATDRQTRAVNCIK
jgi:hypothetical protein